MPSNLHDDFAAEFGHLVQGVIDSILLNMPNAPRILDRRSRAVKLWEHDKSKKTRECLPDGQFMDDHASKPGLIYEVGYSQTGDSLTKVAKDYIVGTRGAVTTVDPTSGKVQAVCDMESTMFQDSNGQMVNSSNLLKLQLTDMAKKKYSDDYPPAPVHIPFGELSRILDFAKSQAGKNSP
ncbi:hypothetical protein F53441_7899 [Fusarium austroafricanum]|uniref:Uncharacterized protein n=1 Tax=Fusarium austroafricanum TaxID=2364996 RepID=A0A8H4KCJ1_9HYPO|nr:hypothetical protein F53441_7899 [Fusarium austroafricanum]